LPDEDNPVFKEETTQANKYGEIVIDKTKIHIPKGYNYDQLHIVKYWDQFKVIFHHGEILHSAFSALYA
jgi:hypothetical protein